MKLDRYINQLVDPYTKKPLRFDGNQLINEIGKNYAINNNKPDFIGIENTVTFIGQRDFLDRFKTILKNRFGRYYTFLIYIISPVYVRIHWPSLNTYFNNKIKKLHNDNKFIIQIGSGNNRLFDNILNIDIFDYEEVDLIADGTNLPFPDNSIDCVISNAVLEHVLNPEAFISEAYRVLKPGGKIITGVPFIQGFHASPNDYYRWTHIGLEYIHTKYGFKKESLVPQSGPTSGFLWILQEWLSIILSLNVNFLYQFWWFLFTVLLMPLKFTDIFFINFKQAHKINSFYIYIGKKPILA